MPNIELRREQIEALGKMHNGCILKGGVGSGKSRVALAYYYLKEGRGTLTINGVGETNPLTVYKDIYIITTAKKRESREWNMDAARFMLGYDPDETVGGVTFVVDSWNNIVNYTEVKDAFFIFDEQRLVGSGAWVKAFYKLAKQNRWIMLSATPGDNWMDYIPVLVANGFYKNRTEFIRRHVVYSSFTKFPKVDRYVEQAHLDNLKRRVVVDMPMARHTTRHVQTITTGHNRELFERVWTDRWNVLDERPLQDVAELFRVARHLVNSDPSRLGAVMELFEKHQKLVIFYNFNYELEALRTLAKVLAVRVAEWNGHKHEPVPDEYDSWIYLVQYSAGAEGWNCTTTDAMIFFSLTYSYKLFEQAQGRIDRMNTPFKDLYYYVLRSDSKIDHAVWKAIVQKRKFNERGVMKEWHD